MSDWAKWIGCHTQPDQVKRLQSAKKAECTPLSIDKAMQSACFSGSSGEYTTMLTSCTCVDFARRKLPCKHMYRLAIELGEISETVVTDKTKIKRKAPAGISLREAVEVIESISLDAQHIVFFVIAEMIYRNKRKHVGVRLSEYVAEAVNAGIFEVCDDLHARILAYELDELIEILLDNGISGINKYMKEDDLASWICENVAIADSLFSDSVSLKLSDCYIRPARKIYTYLNRRNEDDSYYDPGTHSFVSIPCGARFSTSLSVENGSSTALSFPDDEVTELLNLHGVNRCNTWGK